MVSLIPGLVADGRAVVKLHRKGECFDTGNRTEDSDCESGSEQASESGPGECVNGNSGPELESLPVLTAGSFVRYAWHAVAVEQELLTLPVAGGLCSSICVRA